MAFEMHVRSRSDFMTGGFEGEEGGEEGEEGSPFSEDTQLLVFEVLMQVVESSKEDGSSSSSSGRKAGGAGDWAFVPVSVKLKEVGLAEPSFSPAFAGPCHSVRQRSAQSMQGSKHGGSAGCVAGGRALWDGREGAAGVLVSCSSLPRAPGRAMRHSTSTGCRATTEPVHGSSMNLPKCLAVGPKGNRTYLHSATKL